MTPEINISTPLVTKAIELKKQKVEDQSREEIKGIKIAREASGNNPQTRGISTSVDTSRIGITQEIEKAEKALDATLPATSFASTNTEKQKKEEESNKAIEENNQRIIASWSNLGGKEGVS